MTYHYTMCGLDYVHLRSGYQMHQTDYGEGVSVENSDNLDRAIAVHVVTGLARLRGQEARFLRALTGFSQTEIANRLGVKRVTVARWEGAPNTPIPGPADRLLRLVAARVIWKAGKTNVLEALIDIMSEIENEKPAVLTMSYLPHELGSEGPLFPGSDGPEGDEWKPAEVANA